RIAPFVPRVRIVVPAVVIRIRCERHVLNSGPNDEQVLFAGEDFPRLDPLMGTRLEQGRDKAPLVAGAAIVPPQQVAHLFPREAESRARHPAFIPVCGCYTEQPNHVKSSSSVMRRSSPPFGCPPRATWRRRLLRGMWRRTRCPRSPP